MKVLIVGGVAGGASAATRLRRLNESAEIIVFEKGDYISYANCGLPYHVGGVIKDRDDLLLQTPELMKEKYNIDVRIKQEVVAIDTKGKKVEVKKADSSETYFESYDKLILATGSTPVVPPIEGINSPKIMTLWTVTDTDKIRSYISKNSVKNALLVGGGFIGLEMAENLQNAGVSVSVVELLNQVMPSLDYEMAQLIQEHLEQKGVTLHLSDGVAAFRDSGDKITAVLDSGREVDAQLVILAIGVRPNSQLAKEAGLAVNEKGGIVVNNRLETSHKDIYAVGDVIEVENFVDKSPAMIPLAGPANKQGRIVANVLSGIEDKYEGTQGSAVAKIFNITAANTGLNEKQLIKKGLKKGRDYERVIITQNSHAGYYPGAKPLTIKLLFKLDGSILGAQIVGRDGVDKRIDTIGVAMRFGATVYALKNLELAYAPPYSSAKDPVNMVGFVAENVLSGKAIMSSWDDIEKNPDAIIIDVREAVERLAYYAPRSINIPLGQLRERAEALDKNREIIILCAIGVRAYNGARILMQMGFKNVKIYPGGTRFYISTHYKEIAKKGEIGVTQDSGFQKAGEKSES